MPTLLVANLNQELFLKIKENALILSRIYAHHKIYSASVIDLLLAGRAMYHRYRPLILTGNKKDFPSCVFNIETVFTWENEVTNQVKQYYLD